MLILILHINCFHLNLSEFEDSLESHLRGDTGGDFKRMMTSLCTGAKKENEWCDEDEAQADAQKIFEVYEITQIF